MRTARTLLVLAALGHAAPALANSTITIVNVNAPGVGFNDPTPAAPIGGNPGTTLGQQRLIAFQFAADVWGAVLDSKVEIRIQASFEPLTCTATSAVLGSAGTIQIFSNGPGEPANTWHHVALANKLAGIDLAPGAPGTIADDIRARFNVSLGAPNCLAGTGWYLGLDLNHGADIDLVTVLLHEFGHGLGFSTFVGANGTGILGLMDVYANNLFDNTTGKLWSAMTDAERAASILNPRNVVWVGPKVDAAVPTTLARGPPLLQAIAPPSVAGAYQVGAASFGPQLTSPGIAGTVAYANDGVAPAGDACTPILNNVAGKIVLVDRGLCGFTVKVANAQAAGAIGVIVADNVAGGPPAGMGGVDPTITIPSVRITLDDGNKLKNALVGGDIAVLLGVDLSVRAGADAQDRPMIFTPNPRQAGSSVSHWDTSAFPNLLMEPAINADLTHNLDLTEREMRDIGWYVDRDLDQIDDAVDQCTGSNLGSTVAIQSCDSGVANVEFTTGCTIADLVLNCANGARNHGAFVSCVAAVTNSLKSGGFITGDDKGKIQTCAAGSSLP